jgi:rubrerythrin
MSYDFSANDVFEMAEQLERNGADFYRKAAECAADPNAKELLLKLASMEIEHENMFAGLKSNLADKDKVSTVFDPEGESMLYLRSLADTRVFFKKEIDITSMEEVLKSAIVAEKDSIVFYLGMKELVPDKFGKEKLDLIIQEEMQHIRLLSKELIALNK